MKENPKRTIRKAEEHIDKVAQDSFERSYEQFEKELHGRGCGCMQCKHIAVREYQKDCDWQSKGKEPVRWSVDKDGNICWHIDHDKLDDLL